MLRARIQCCAAVCGQVVRVQEEAFKIPKDTKSYRCCHPQVSTPHEHAWQTLRGAAHREVRLAGPPRRLLSVVATPPTPRPGATSPRHSRTSTSNVLCTALLSASSDKAIVTLLWSSCARRPFAPLSQGGVQPHRRRGRQGASQKHEEVPWHQEAVVSVVPSPAGNAPIDIYNRTSCSRYRNSIIMRMDRAASSEGSRRTSFHSTTCTCAASAIAPPRKRHGDLYCTYA